ncbi:MAG: ABC transporter permease [Clostridiales bacterium]|jgi:putative ABC transport system permease protein|nr:ABC transporter permease [Clostridiales bacterium]
MLDTLLAGVCQGLIWAVLALGVYISFRILDFADLTCEGCITLGASISALLIWKELNPFLSVLVAFLAGSIAGTVTGLLNTKLKIPPILSGILTMISLYSINIHIMSLATGTGGTANLSLLTFRGNTAYAQVASLLGLGRVYSSLIFGVVVVLAVSGVLYWFFGTELGCAIRATGANATMCRSQGINTDLTKLCGLALSNGLIATSGALLCQYQNYADVNMGVGSIIIGLASIIIGETLFMKFQNFYMKLTGVILGAVIYRVVVAFVIYSGMPSTDLKIMTAGIVTVALALPTIQKSIASSRLFKKARRRENGRREGGGENG